MGMLIPFVLICGVMYFMMIRPQKKQQQQRQTLLNAMKAGDKVITIGGLHGIISEINSDTDTITIDCEGIYLEFDRNAIKTTVPASEAADEATTDTNETADVASKEEVKTEAPEDIEVSTEVEETSEKENQ